MRKFLVCYARLLYNLRTKFCFGFLLEVVHLSIPKFLKKSFCPKVTRLMKIQGVLTLRNDKDIPLEFEQ